MDERLQKLATNILTKSVRLQPGEKIYLDAVGKECLPLLQTLLEKAVKMGGIPFYFHNTEGLNNALLSHCTESQVKDFANFHADIMRQMDVFVGIRSIEEEEKNAANVSAQARKWYNQYFLGDVHMNIRLPNTRWCILRYPTSLMAKEANLTLYEFSELYYKSSLLDYSQLETLMQPLVERMKQTNKVRIIGPHTDLLFSIKDVGVVPCFGLRNIPDGEIFSAPIKDSIDGRIRFNTPTTYNGKKFSNITLFFKKGRIVDAYHDGNKQDILDILDTDEGSRYIGEFALGINPFITKSIGNTLFDEKISGSLHMAIGNAYKNAFNGNVSSIHWDLVQIQTPEYGGGEIWFDNELIRLQGRFIPSDLEHLNPENLSKLSI
ncbi:MAG: aminopeptidase [Alphaproteobacteria bacterium]|nr:aminopeptidase [Alphaproteobacteria bacterium]